MKKIDIFKKTLRRSAQDRRPHLAKPSPPSGYGYDYWDNPEYAGYGGYFYDGRYRSAALEMCAMFGLHPGSTLLEIGCAKGFILYEFHLLGMAVTGLDASEYAVSHAKEEIRPFVQVHSACSLPFEAKTFDFVLAKEVLPHLAEGEAIQLLTEIGRVGRQSFVEIQCADTQDSADLMRRWDPTHQTIRPEQWWVNQLSSVNYSGAYHCHQLF